MGYGKQTLDEIMDEAQANAGKSAQTPAVSEPKPREVDLDSMPRSTSDAQWLLARSIIGVIDLIGGQPTKCELSQGLAVTLIDGSGLSPLEPGDVLTVGEYTVEIEAIAILDTTFWVKLY